MTPLNGILLTISIVALVVAIRVQLDTRQRIVLSVSRPTTADGETVQLTANLRGKAGWKEISGTVEKMSLAVQARMAAQNQIISEANAEQGHQIWLRIKKKLDLAEKQGRHGVGILNKGERAWWLEHKIDYDEDGPRVKQARVEQSLRTAEKGGEEA